MKEKIKKIFEIIGEKISFSIIMIIVFIILFIFSSIIDFIFDSDFYLEKSLDGFGYNILFNEKDKYIEERDIIELMCSDKSYDVTVIFNKPTYKYIKSWQFKYKNPEYEDDKTGVASEYNYDIKAMLEVTSYDYSFAYKNAVKVTNKYIEENENASKEEIEKYFANRLEYEWKYIKKNNIKKSIYIYRMEGHNRSYGGGTVDCVTFLPYQNNNEDLENAVFGGLVEEMDRTKLPEGVDLEETLQLMGIE
ncbi:hypothetical protein [Anaerofustis butyriciformans]|uniref:hypothetical protein n=1 Tax=Anaerofustis butyriciformans TaxID=3108533 RepID=UPI003F88772E